MNDLLNMNNQITQASTYLDQLSSTLTPKTRKSYMSDIRQFFNITKASDLTIDMVKSITVDDVNIYAEELFNKGYANTTINRKLQALTKFYNLLLRRDIRMVEYNPFDTKEGANRFKAKDYSGGRELEDKEVQQMIDIVRADDTILGLRNTIILFTLITTGMRREEVANLTVGQISKTQGKYIIDFTGKGRKDRFVVLANNIKALIDQYLELRGVTYKDKTAPLFISHSNNSNKNKCISAEAIYQLIKKLSSEAGIEGDVSPHDLRHTYVTKSIDMGNDIETVSKRVGHNSVNTTRRYDHTNRILKGNPADDIMSLYED